MASRRPQNDDLVRLATVVLVPLDAQDLAQLLSVIADWRNAAAEPVLADLTGFLGGYSDRAAWITAAGETAVMLLRQLRPHTCRHRPPVRYKSLEVGPFIGTPTPLLPPLNGDRHRGRSPAHAPPRTAELDVAHTSCIVGFR